MQVLVSKLATLHYTHGDVDQCGPDDDEDDCDIYVSSFFEDGGEESGLTWGSDGAIERLIDLLDHRRGGLLTSSYEFPGRYVRCFIMFVGLQLYEYGLKYLIANLQTQHILFYFFYPLTTNKKICTLVTRFRRSTPRGIRYR